MSVGQRRSVRLPLEDELNVHRIGNAAGIEISVFPNGCVFAIEHRLGESRILINQVLGSPLGSGIGRIVLRLGDDRPPLQIAGPVAAGRTGAASDRFVWESESDGVRHRVTLWLHPAEPVWLWRVEIENTGAEPFGCDAILIQDLGLGERGFILGNETYASQYLDHAIARHTDFGPVVMSRQNLSQAGRNPWIAHGCLDGAASFATDALQVFGPAHREAPERMPGLAAMASLPGERLQHEAGCAAIQSYPLIIAPGETVAQTFFALFVPDHPAATDGTDLDRLDCLSNVLDDFQSRDVPLAVSDRSILQHAVSLAGLPVAAEDIERDFPERFLEERDGGELLSFFAPDGPINRHIVLAAKERRMRRRHGHILRSGAAMLPDERTLSATCWMQGVFAAQLTLGNTALHKLLSVSRDPTT
ncbi:MAG: hypothetical protein HC850_06595 [Rhodomicrobium sp.]|nr:hypothetical protein [Rhodomicrobium sp.]